MERINRLHTLKDLPDNDLLSLISDQAATEPLALAADSVRRQVYGEDVYIRGLIELTNYCKNNCYYCGIRRDNKEVTRYRLTKQNVLDCCETGFSLGFRTFVLQGGEDSHFTAKVLCDLVESIKSAHPDCAVTLSMGEYTKEDYQAMFSAGADRYLLRHETADDCHYSQLHPENLTAKNRKRCLYDLKEIGFQVGAGFMVGSPYQTNAHLLSDLRFLQELDPDMIGIGPFLPHHATPFANRPKGDLSLTLRMLALVRLLFPHALLPATTALGTLHPDGRVLGLQAGGNVVMPNLSPTTVRKLYTLYEDKINTDAESAEGLLLLKEQVAKAGYQIVTARGDVKR